MSDPTFIHNRTLGVTFSTDGQAAVTVWHPGARQVALLVVGGSGPVSLSRQPNGYWHTETNAICPGDEYLILVDDEREYPDTASLAQPQGPFGPSLAVDTGQFYWEDTCWVNHPFEQYRVAELDLRTFTREGTLAAATARVARLKTEGINAVAINPTLSALYSPDRPFDTAFLFAIQPDFGSPRQLQQFVNVCHFEGIAVCLDLDYSFLDAPSSHTLAGGWGKMPAMRTGNRDRPSGVGYPDALQRYCLENALLWWRDFHVDALRLNGLAFLPDADETVQLMREAANQLAHVNGHQYYLLVDCDASPATLTGSSGQRFLCRADSDRVTASEASPTDLPSRTYRSDYVYDRQYAAVLHSLFG
ncbi:hypothetical protein F5984_12595 [Rudanella paleaurantiibacter]|uniref:DUF3459 domain-containing protein n=1 Tax=Rudanella paleaurantiibacter TaxID=2614655 RepID=A0A7J5TY05_9BACT|nr:hypothetical protein [Rudanella paleaurantiibacter]KAB7730018.1 hypothetical protein F5984_12595 [Rudanella paleaurantiibacter]